MRRFFFILGSVILGVVAGLGARLLFVPKAAPVAVPAASSASTDAPVAQSKAEVTPPARPSGKAEVEPWPTGYVVRGARITVTMSDGTTRTEADTEMTEVRRNSITLAGKKLFFRAAPLLGVVTAAVVAGILFARQAHRQGRLRRSLRPLSLRPHRRTMSPHRRG